MSETLVTNLRPWTVYHLRVFAENQLGKSKDGKVLQVNCLTSWKDFFFFQKYVKVFFLFLLLFSLSLMVKSPADLLVMFALQA